ncbi:MAG: hypothetical protein AB1Z23_03005 [Eubacteriales bacterium]
MKQIDAWKMLCDDIGGNFLVSKHFKIPRVELIYKNFLFCLDTYTVSTGKSTMTFTRMRAMFINKEEFAFKIYKEGFFAKIGKFFGMEDIEIGDEMVDKKLIIKSENEFLIKDLLAKEDIRQKLKEIKYINLCIEKKLYENKEHLYKESVLNQTQVGIIKDVELLKSWYYLFAAIIDGMTELDITMDTAPENVIFKEK